MKFSVITVNYNNKEGLEKTILSVISQKYKDYEYIIVDGGSTDGSREVIEQYKEHFSWWCSEKDSGVYNAMNKGIIHANGDYLIFMNSGDVFYDETVLSRIANLNFDADIISGQVERMDNAKLIRKYDGKGLLMQLYFDTINHQGSFIKRNLFDKSLYDESLRVVSDWKFWVEKIVFEGCKIEVIDMIIAKQDMTGLSSLATSSSWLEERKKVRDALFPKMIQEVLNEWNRKRNLKNRIYFFLIKFRKSLFHYR